MQMCTVDVDTWTPFSPNNMGYLWDVEHRKKKKEIGSVKRPNGSMMV